MLKSINFNNILKDFQEEREYIVKEIYKFLKDWCWQQYQKKLIVKFK
jgi:hypothetical protein